MVYVIGAAHSVAPWLLSFEPYASEERAHRAIAWQRLGQGQFERPDYWAIKTADELRELLPTMSAEPYTLKAWNEFVKSFNGVKANG